MECEHLGRRVLHALQRDLATPRARRRDRQALARIDQRAVEGVVEQLGWSADQPRPGRWAELSKQVVELREARPVIV